MKKHQTDRLPPAKEGNYKGGALKKGKFRTESAKGFYDEHFSGGKSGEKKGNREEEREVKRNLKFNENSEGDIKPIFQDSPQSPLEKELLYIEKALEGFWRANSSKLNSNETAFVEYFKLIFDYLTLLSEKCQNAGGLLNSILLVFGYPINLIFIEWQKLLKTIEDLKSEFNDGQKKRVKEEIEAQKMLKIFSQSSNQKTIQKEIENLLHENVKLKSSLKRSKEMLKENRSREEKAMKLIYAIRMKGIDIEEIFNSQVRTPAISSCHTPDENSEIEFVKQRLMEEWQLQSESDEKEPEERAPPKPGLKLNLQGIDREGPGFHEEFMARLDEFSLSWRKAAMEEKKF